MRTRYRLHRTSVRHVVARDYGPGRTSPSETVFIPSRRDKGSSARQGLSSPMCGTKRGCLGPLHRAGHRRAVIIHIWSGGRRGTRAGNFVTKQSLSKYASVSTGLSRLAPQKGRAAVAKPLVCTPGLGLAYFAVKPGRFCLHHRQRSVRILADAGATGLIGKALHLGPPRAADQGSWRI